MDSWIIWQEEVYLLYLLLCTSYDSVVTCTEVCMYLTDAHKYPLIKSHDNMHTATVTTKQSCGNSSCKATCNQWDKNFAYLSLQFKILSGRASLDDKKNPRWWEEMIRKNNLFYLSWEIEWELREVYSRLTGPHCYLVFVSFFVKKPWVELLDLRGWEEGIWLLC